MFAMCNKSLSVHPVYFRTYWFYNIFVCAVQTPIWDFSVCDFLFLCLLYYRWALGRVWTFLRWTPVFLLKVHAVIKVAPKKVLATSGTLCYKAQSFMEDLSWRLCCPMVINHVFHIIWLQALTDEQEVMGLVRWRDAVSAGHFILCQALSCLKKIYNCVMGVALKKV